MVSLGLQGYTSLLAQHGFDELDALAEEDPSNLISIGMLEADALSVVQHALLQTFANADADGSGGIGKLLVLLQLFSLLRSSSSTSSCYLSSCVLSCSLVSFFF